MSVFISDKDSAQLYVQFLSEILKPFKKLAVVYYKV